MNISRFSFIILKLNIYYIYLYTGTLSVLILLFVDCAAADSSISQPLFFLRSSRDQLASVLAVQGAEPGSSVYAGLSSAHHAFHLDSSWLYEDDGALAVAEAAVNIFFN